MLLPHNNGSKSPKEYNLNQYKKIELTPYAPQTCHIIIQISETQFLISIPMHAVPIGHLICHNHFGLIHSCWLWEWNLVGKIHQNTQIQQPF